MPRPSDAFLPCSPMNSFPLVLEWFLRVPSRQQLQMAPKGEIEGGGGEVQWHQWSFDKNLVAQIHTLWNKRNDKIHHGVRLLAHSVCVSVQYLLFYFSVCSVKTAKWGHSEYSYHPNASGNNADYRGAGAQREIGVSLWQMQALSSSTECWRPWTVLSCPGHRIIPMYFGVNKFINYGPIVGVFCL